MMATIIVENDDLRVEVEVDFDFESSSRNGNDLVNEIIEQAEAMVGELEGVLPQLTEGMDDDDVTHVGNNACEECGETLEQRRPKCFKQEHENCQNCTVRVNAHCTHCAGE